MLPLQQVIKCENIIFQSTNLSINLLNYHTNLFITKFDLENESINTHTNASYLFIYLSI